MVEPRYKTGDFIINLGSYGITLVKIEGIKFSAGYPYYLVKVLKDLDKNNTPYRWRIIGEQVLLAVEIIDRKAKYLGNNETLIKIIYNL